MLRVIGVLLMDRRHMLAGKKITEELGLVELRADVARESTWIMARAAESNW